MQQLLSLTGNIAAILGILLCTVSGLARVSGLYYMAGYQSTTIFIVGTGLMVFACLAKLEIVLAQQKLN
jgi:type IV secretory pathway VirB2 component (pilin)